MILVKYEKHLLNNINCHIQYFSFTFETKYISKCSKVPKYKAAIEQQQLCEDVLKHIYVPVNVAYQCNLFSGQVPKI